MTTVLEIENLKETLNRGDIKFPLESYVWSGYNFDNNIKMHWHSDVELVRFIKGDFSYTIKMQEYKIKDRAIAFIPANVLHSFILPSYSSESAVVFNPKMLPFSEYDESERALSKALIKGYTSLYNPITPDDPDFEYLDEAIDYIVTNSKDNSICSRLRIKSKLIEIFAILQSKGYFSEEEAIADTSSMQREDRVKHLLKYISENYPKNITVNETAEKLGFTTEYFCRFFKKNFGESFIEYLNDYRMDRAAQELLLTNLPVARIGENCGYQNSGYFFRVFKKKFGCTPNQFRTLKSSKN